MNRAFPATRKQHCFIFTQITTFEKNSPFIFIIAIRSFVICSMAGFAIHPVHFYFVGTLTGNGVAGSFQA